MQRATQFGSHPVKDQAGTGDAFRLKDEIRPETARFLIKIHRRGEQSGCNHHSQQHLKKREGCSPSLSLGQARLGDVAHRLLIWQQGRRLASDHSGKACLPTKFLRLNDDFHQRQPSAHVQIFAWLGYLDLPGPLFEWRFEHSRWGDLQRVQPKLNLLFCWQP